MEISCMIVDDEPMAVNLLKVYIDQFPQLSLSYTSHHAADALAYLQKTKVHLIFLDINMPYLSGMELADLLDPGPLIIFTTAYADFAAESYEKNAVDYLLKPVTPERFSKAIDKATRLLTLSQVTGVIQDQEILFIKTGRTFLQFRYADIYFIEGLRDYVSIHTKTDKHAIYKRMKDLENTLPDQFSRVHNSYIVNRQHIQKITEDGIVLFNMQKSIPVSDKYRGIFLGKINGQLL